MWGEWIRHGGDGVPVLDGTLVQVRFKNRTEQEMIVDQRTWSHPASSWDWNWEHLFVPILEYRVWENPVKKKEKENALDW